MISEWIFPSMKKIGFEDMKIAIEYPKKYIIINTMPLSDQDCLIKNTIPIESEEKIINDILDNYEMKKKKIIIYGKNNVDNTMEKKYKQLSSLGFSEIYIYYGGIFEWMLLQDIYSDDEFPTTKKVLDILKFRPASIFDSKN